MLQFLGNLQSLGNLGLSPVTTNKKKSIASQVVDGHSSVLSGAVLNPSPNISSMVFTMQSWQWAVFFQLYFFLVCTSIRVLTRFWTARLVVNKLTGSAPGNVIGNVIWFQLSTRLDSIDLNNGVSKGVWSLSQLKVETNSPLYFRCNSLNSWFLFQPSIQHLINQNWNGVQIFLFCQFRLKHEESVFFCW